MDLAEKILSVPQRENAGSRTSNRYSYQHIWAFNHMLSLIDSDKDFMLLMEFHDDIFILDSSESPQFINFYQIKTDDKRSRYITPSFIVKDFKKYPEKMSIAQKLIDNYSKFRSETKSIHLVSNKSFDFENLKDNTNSTDRNTIGLYEVEHKIFSKIKEGMCDACECNECVFEKGCHNNCMYLIYFDVSSLDLINYEETVLGKFVNYLSRKSIESTLTRTKSIFYTILSEIKRINNCEKRAYDFDELLKLKSITREELLNMINNLRIDTTDDMWEDIRSYMLHDGFSTFEATKVGQQWKRCNIDLMNIDNLLLLEIREDVRKIISKSGFDNCKSFTEYIYSELRNKKYFKIYSKEYLYAIILKEMFS